MIGRLDIAYEIRSRILQILSNRLEQFLTLVEFSSECHRNRIRGDVFQLGK